MKKPWKVTCANCFPESPALPPPVRAMRVFCPVGACITGRCEGSERVHIAQPPPAIGAGVKRQAAPCDRSGFVLVNGARGET